jgi:glycoprotein-N-acetylgalactosamine 3-beta-galactosyltransferase
MKGEEVRMFMACLLLACIMILITLGHFHLQNLKSLQEETAEVQPLVLEIVNHTAASSNRLLCFICAISTAESIQRSKIIAQTWGSHCDKLIFVAPKQIGDLETLVIPPFPGETRINLYPKIYTAWQLVIEKYANEADWFLKADDDTFFNVPNFKAYVSREFNDTSIPRFVGERFKHPREPGRTFASGGPGYALNRAGLDRLAKGMQNNSLCPLTTGPEDTRFADCLYSVGVECEDTREWPYGGDRFLHIPLETRLNARKMSKVRWWKKRSFNWTKGWKCCAKELISVHKLSVDQLKSYYEKFY